MTRLRGRLPLLLLLGLALLGVKRPPGLEDVVEVRHWSYEDYTRVVVELSGPMREQGPIRVLPPFEGRPERLYIDLEGVWVGKRFDAGLKVGDGLLRGIRIGQNRLNRVRVVLDLLTHTRHRVLTLSHPDRLVIDVYGERSAEKGGPSSSEPRLPSGLRRLQTVVLDPGHGGRDPGAVGVGNLQEKDVTLKLARVLRPKLEARQFRVVMTRNEDRGLDLEERSAIAEAERGDLFVSIHANASRRSAAHGIETYYLDENHERHSLTVAARENGVEPGQVNALQRTLAKLRVSEVSPLSRRLAEHLQQGMVKGLSRRFGKIEDLGAKKGPFYVLFLSTMPAVLVETGFVTHRGESRRLRDPLYLDALAEEIAEAITRYREAGHSIAAWRAP